MNPKALKEIQCAVEALGYKIHTMNAHEESFHHIRVAVNGEDLGLYDLDKHTFID